MKVALMPKSTKNHFSTVQEWNESGQVLILSYGELVSLMYGEKFSKTERTSLDKYLKHPGPDIVVCDEGHLLKNEKTLYFQVIASNYTVSHPVS